MIPDSTYVPELILGRLKQRTSRPRISLIKHKKAKRPTLALHFDCGCVFSPSWWLGFELEIELAAFLSLSHSWISLIFLSVSFSLFPSLCRLYRQKKRRRFQDVAKYSIKATWDSQRYLSTSTPLFRSSCQLNCALLGVISHDEKYTNSFESLHGWMYISFKQIFLTFFYSDCVFRVCILF